MFNCKDGIQLSLSSQIKTMKLFLLAIAIVGIAVLGIAIKMFFIKDAEFQKSCGSIDPTTGQKISCTCGKPEEEQCDNKSGGERSFTEEIKPLG